MKFEGIKDFSFDLKKPENIWNTQEEADIKKVGAEKIDSLKKIVEEIKEMIEGREKLSKEIFNEGEKIKTEINNFIMENDRMTFGSPQDQRDVVREKNDLRHKKIEISELQLNERVTCWKDIALLKRELREYERELDERQNRIEAIDKLMEE